MIRLYFCLLLLWALPAIAAAAPPAFVSPRFADHPLAGRIWSVGQGRFIGPDELASRAAAARFALLGEIHDNPDHHALQAWTIREIARAGRRPSVVFEMVPQDMQPEIDAFLADPDKKPEDFGKAVDWQERGWPVWSSYQPILEAALDAGLPIVAGDVTSATRKSVGGAGLTALGDEERTRLGLDGELEAISGGRMLDTLFAGHCELVPREALQPMAAVQRLRDAALADALLMSLQDGAVLIAGGGHVRSDLGVPAYLRQRGAKGGIVTIVFREVDPAIETPAAYLETGDGEAPAHDYLWFTPAMERADPCIDLRERFGKKG